MSEKLQQYDDKWLPMTPPMFPAAPSPFQAPTPKLLSSCPHCEKKDETIETLQRICRGYEIRIKRFQTLSRNRRKGKKR